MMYVISFDVGIRNLAYAIIQYEQVQHPKPYVKDREEILGRTNIKLWNKVDLGCNKYDIEKISSSLLEVLDNIAYNEIEDIYGSTVHVVIENQPALKSPTMKSIQIIIYTYFNTIAKYSSLDMKTKLISAKSKLKYIESFPEFVGDCAKTGYAKNKSDSVAFTRWLLNNKAPNEKAMSSLEAIKKRDDICDSYLQGLYYINNLE